VVGRVPVGRVLVDGTGVGDVGAAVLRERQLLAESGLVCVALAVTREGVVAAGPDIATRGVVYAPEHGPLLDELREAVRAALAGRPPGELADRETLAALVRTTVRGFLTRRVQRKPVVVPVILDV
jgi:ribonuclease J